MKKIILFCLIIFSSVLNAQWVKQHTGLQDYYTDMTFVDSLNGFTIGFQNVIGGSEFILKTTDSGESWNQIEINCLLPLSVSFNNNSIGYIAAFDGIYKTTDGGNSWNQNYPGSVDTQFNSIRFTDQNKGWAIASNSMQDLFLFKTDDGGLNWNKTLITSSSHTLFPKIEMVNELVGFVFAQSWLYKTSDGGNSWTLVFNDTNTVYYSCDISFGNEQNGFLIVQFEGGSKLFRTGDSGNSWQKQLLHGFGSFIKAKDNHCVLAGNSGLHQPIIYSDDYGISWTPIIINDTISIRDIFLTDENNIWYYTMKNSYYSEDASIYKLESDWLSNITVPFTPQQIYPIDGASIEQASINFSWEMIDNSTSRFQISTDSLFNNFYVILNPNTGDTICGGNDIYYKNEATINFPGNKYYWRVRAENHVGVSDWSETKSFIVLTPNDVNEKNILNKFELKQNYPNPFNPGTKISWQSSVSSHQTLKVYDVLGNEVATLVDEEKSAGSFEIEFDASELSSGIYFYKLTAGTFVETKKMILLR